MKTIYLLLTITLLSGCSAYHGWYGETKPMVSYVELTGTPKNEARLFVWSPKNNAAFANNRSQGCIQGAEIFHEKGGTVDISKDLIAMMSKIATSSSATPEEKAFAIKLTNDIVNLRSNTERTTYLSIGMFGLCQLNMNGGITNNELIRLVSELIEKSSSLKTLN